MKPTEAAALLTIAASFDNRKPDADAAKAWSIALDGLRFEDCRDAIVAHYRASSDWLMPQKVIAEVKRLRAKRLAATPEPIPPADLTPLQTIAWLKEARRRIADGEQIEATEAPAIEHRRDVRELSQAKSVDSALAGRDAREAIRQARMELQAAEDEQQRAKEEKQAARRTAREADLAARAELKETA